MADFCLVVGWAQACSAKPIMPDEPHGIAVLHHGLFAGNALVHRDQHFFLPQELENGPERPPLPLNQLPDIHRGGNLAGKVTLPFCCLQLPHQGNRYHVRFLIAGALRLGVEGPRRIDSSQVVC